MMMSRAALRDSCVYLVTLSDYSAQRSGGSPLGGRCGEGGVEANMSMSVHFIARVSISLPDRMSRKNVTPSQL